MSVYTYRLANGTDFPCFPGVYLMYTLTTNNTHQCFPIFKTTNLTTILSDSSLDATTTAIMTIPGFRCQLYSNATATTLMAAPNDISNNSTTNPTVTDITNNVLKSIKIYFGSTSAGWTEIT